MKSKFKRALAFTASLSMCGITLLHFPSGTFDISLPVMAAEGDVAIDATNFPDETFRNYVSDNFDANADTMLDADEIAAVTFINVSDMCITDLTGVEYFTALTYLDYESNQLTSLDVSKNTALTELYCSNNQLESLDVSKNTALTELYCSNNQLESLDVSKNTALTSLYCFSNQLTSFDVSGCTVLTNLDCESNPLWKLDLPAAYNGALSFDAENTISAAGNTHDLSAYKLDAEHFSGGTLDENGILTPDSIPGRVTYTYPLTNGETLTVYVEFGLPIDKAHFPDEQFRTYVMDTIDTDGDAVLSPEEAAVTSIYVSEMNITTLKGVEYFTELEYLYCSGNLLTSLDVTANTELTYLDCSGNLLTSLDVTANTELTTLYCKGNLLTSLDVSQNTELIHLSCYENQLESLDVSQNTKLTYLSCEGNQLTSLDVSGCTSLTYLSCYGNQLTSLDVSKNTELTTLYCYNNQLTSLDVKANTELTTLYCYGNQLTSLDLKANTELTDLSCEGNQLWKLDLPTDYNGALGFDANNTILAADKTHDLSAYKLDAEKFSGGTLDENGILTPDSIPGRVTYTYPLTNDDTLTVYVEFGLPIDKAHFPDDAFRTYVMDTIDTDGDAVLSPEEAEIVTSMNVSEMNITDLTGVEYFTKLQYLSCYDNQLTSLDVSKNTELTDLNCDNNQLTSLDVSKNTALTELYCYGNQLTALDVSQNTALTSLSCSDNQLESLDVSQNTELTHLYCYNNQLTALDVSGCTALEGLYCYGNQLTALDVSGCTALERLYCYGNQLESLDVSQNTKLNTLYCYNNQLTSLDVSKNTALELLSCSGNQLTSLDVSKNTALTYLSCQSNQLTSLDVSQNTKLTYLSCSGNQLTSLDVSENTALTDLYCQGNQLTSLDVTKNTELTYLSCSGNQLTSLNVSQNTALTELLVSDNAYGIDLVGGIFDLTTLPEGFDVTKASDWTNATVDGNILTVSDLGATITYRYDCGNDSSEIFTLIPVSCTITEDMIQAIGEQTYNGSAIEPVTIRFGEYTLAESTDYTVSYENNVNVGTATATITGMGMFNGEITVKFEIEKAVLMRPAMSYLTATYGDTLADVDLPEGYTWQDDLTTSVGNAGTNTFLATFTPADTDNYEIEEDIEVEVEVAKAVPEVTPIIPEGEYTEGDALPEILYRSETDGLIAWMTELKQLIAGENVLEWQFTPDEADNYEVVTGTAVIVAEETTTTTTTETTTETTTTITTADGGSDTTTSTTTTTADGGSDTTTSTTTATDDGDSDTTTSTTTTTTADGESDTTTSTTTATDDGESDTTASTTTATDDGESDTTTSTTTTATADGGSDTTTSTTTPSHIASDEELCDWAVKDYAGKTGVTPEHAEIEYTADGNAVITLTDAEGNVLDIYNIDPFTGVGTESDGGEVNLPQTGFSVVYNYIMLAAAAMVLFGIYAMAKSRKEQDAE